MSYTKKSNLTYIVLIILTQVSFAIKIVYGGSYNQDLYPYIEGGWLITKGLLPYIDFYIPVGPIVYLIQGFFTAFTGANIHAVFMHLLFYALTLSLLSFYIFKKIANNLFSMLLSISLPISTNLLTGLPLYTSTAIFFVSINILILINDEITGGNKNKTLLFSITLLVLSMFSKHDVGFIHSVFLTIYFFINSNQKVSNLKHLLYIFPALVLLLLNFKYIMNMPNAEVGRINEFISRLGTHKILLSWQFITIIISLVSVKFYKGLNQNLLIIYFYILTLTLIVSNTSGYEYQVRFAMLPILLFLIFLGLKGTDEKNNKRIQIFLCIFLAMSLKLPSYFSDVARQIYYLNQKNINTGLMRLSLDCLKYHKVPEEVFKDIGTIKTIFENSKSFVIVGVGDYQFFYPMLNQLPPPQTPLWYHVDTTVNKTQELNLLKKYLINNPDFILASDESDVAINFFEISGYEIVNRFKLYGGRACSHCIMYMLKKT